MNRNYWKPEDANVGDCMPFFHNGLFHVFYLRDLGHHNHPLVGTRGGHEWSHCVSSDLKHFEEWPMALPLDFANGECSNCTGSLLAHGEYIYAFYALRSTKFEGEQFRVARSKDGGRTFEKWDEPELKEHPDGFTGQFRDPKAYTDETGTVHLLVTSARAPSKEDPASFVGALLHFTTKDMIHYKFEGPVLQTRGAPECSDIFQWGGRCYLFYSLGLATHALVSDSFSGPWKTTDQNIPASRYCAVMKTAPWKDGRRIGVAWIPTFGAPGFLFGGRMIFREMIQNPDGSLGTAFLPETLENHTRKTSLEDRKITTSLGLDEVALGRVPDHFRLEGEIDFSENRPYEFGFFLTNEITQPRLLVFHPAAHYVEMDRTSGIFFWDSTPGKVSFRMERSNDILDLEINGNRTLALACAESADASLFFYAVDGTALLKNAVLFEIPEEK